MDGLSWNIPVKIDDLGYPHFKKPPFPEKKHKVYKSGPVELYHPASKRGISWLKMKAACLHKASVSCYGKLRMCPIRSSNTAIVDDRSIHPKQTSISLRSIGDMPRLTIILGSKFETKPHILVILKMFKDV